MDGNIGGYSSAQQTNNAGRSTNGNGNANANSQGSTHLNGQSNGQAHGQTGGHGNGYGAPAAADPSTLVGSFGGLNLHGNIHGVNMPAQAAPMPVGPGGPWIASMGNNYHHMGAMQAFQGVTLPPQGDNQTFVQGHGYGGARFSGPYYGMSVPMGMMPYTPGRTDFQPPAGRADRGHTEFVPGLENRRGSYSTNESTPATPYWGGGHTRQELMTRVASHDRSAYTTPSPQAFGFPDAPKPVSAPIPEATLTALLEKEPPVPKAVPAVFTPPGQMKSVDQSLENRIPGNRNVYIRGLHPTTDDDTLFMYAARFGAVETSKAIIDTGTGACKGYTSICYPSSDLLLTSVAVLASLSFTTYATLRCAFAASTTLATKSASLA